MIEDSAADKAAFSNCQLHAFGAGRKTKSGGTQGVDGRRRDARGTIFTRLEDTAGFPWVKQASPRLCKHPKGESSRQTSGIWWE